MYSVSLDVLQPADGFSAIFGADDDANARTDEHRKFLRIGMPHFDNEELPVALIKGDSNGTDNVIAIGGGFGGGNAATIIQLVTAENDKTPGGAVRVQVSAQGVIIGGFTPEAMLHINGTLRADDIASFRQVEPVEDNATYLGRNNDDDPKAFKGIILKDQGNGKYYRIEAVNGALTLTDLAD